MDKSHTPAQRKNQLLGTWRSDKKRNLEELAKRRDLPKKQQVFLREIFNELEETICFRPATFVVSSNGSNTTEKYEILSAGSSCVAIRTKGKFPFIDPRTMHIHFKGDHQWITLGGDTCAFFKRVKSKPTSQRVRRKSIKPASVKFAGPHNIREWIGKGKGGLKKMGYENGDDFVRDIRGR